MSHFSFEFDNINEETSALLVALLSEQGFEGFEETGDSLIAFVPETLFSEGAFFEVMNRLPAVSYTRSSVAPANWNALWESSFEPVIVDDFAAVRAHFHEPVPGVRQEIIITPRMSFGTGHHATTWMMIRSMEELDFSGKQVLDFGTGTGVLAILAEKLGAAAVTAIDIDEWSIRNSEENVAANNCSRIELAQADHMPGDQQYDIILANINLNVILQSLPAMVTAARTGTEMLLSGFLETDMPVMQKALEEAGFSLISKEQKGEWVCLLVSKK